MKTSKNQINETIAEFTKCLERTFEQAKAEIDFSSKAKPQLRALAEVADHFGFKVSAAYLTRNFREEPLFKLNAVFYIDTKSFKDEKLMGFLEELLNLPDVQAATSDLPEQSQRNYTFDSPQTRAMVYVSLIEGDATCRRVLVDTKLQTVPVYEFRCE